MVKNCSYIFVLLLICLSTNAQDIDRLKSLNAKTKIQFVTPEALDQVAISLRSYENVSGAEVDSIVLDTYLSITAGYMSNNHFKQAYEVYNKYLTRKENMLAADKAASITSVTNSVSTRKDKDEVEQSALLTQVQQLKEDNDRLESKRLSFKRNFSFALIILSSIFAIMIVSAGIRMMSIRSKLWQSRERMKHIHRLSLIGNFESGLRSNLKFNITTLDAQTRDLQQSLKKQEQNNSPVKQANQIISGIEKIFRELKERL